MVRLSAYTFLSFFAPILGRTAQANHARSQQDSRTHFLLYCAAGIYSSSLSHRTVGGTEVVRQLFGILLSTLTLPKTNLSLYCTLSVAMSGHSAPTSPTSPTVSLYGTEPHEMKRQPGSGPYMMDSDTNMQRQPSSGPCISNFLAYLSSMRTDLKLF